MGCTHNLIYNYNTHHTLHHFTISFFLLLISTSTQLSFTAAGRTLGNPLAHSQEDKMILRGQIGSRPPRCERRCSSCEQCEAIQVPTNPQTKGGSKIKSTNKLFTIAYSRSDDNSNYKAMSWKCKCGNSIFTINTTTF